ALAGARARERSVADAVASLGCATPADADLRGTAERLREESGALTGLAAEALRQEEDRRRVAHLEQAAAATSRDLAVLVSQLDEVPARLAAARSAVEESALAAARLTQVAGLAAAAGELPRVEASFRVADEARRDAVDGHQGARDALLRVRRERLEGMAVELAGELRSGQACPVCGSAEHPAPARPLLETVTAADEDAAAEVEQRAADRRARAEQEAQKLEVRLAHLREQLGDRSPDELDREHRAVAALAGRVEARQAELAGLEGQVEAALERRGRLERDLERAGAQRDELAAAVEEREARLEEARGDFPDVVARRAHLSDLADALTDLHARRVAAAEDAERLAEQRLEVSRLAAGAGFADVAEALAAARPDAAVAALEERVRRAEHGRAAAESTLVELADLDPAAVVDVAGAEARFRA
ncbi:SMC family ATPase, partial [Saccharothrix lopnurensis]